MASLNVDPLAALPGAVHASLSIIIGYPFDTVKTRLQTGIYTSFTDCVLHSARKEGVSVFYKGCTLPLTALLFKRPMEWAVYEALNSSPEYNFGYFVNGGCAAVLGAFLGSPFNVAKVRAQNSQTKVPLRELLRSIKNEKPYGMGFFKGLHVSFLYTIPSATLYLGIYGKAREHLTSVASGTNGNFENLATGSTATSNANNNATANSAQSSASATDRSTATKSGASSNGHETHGGGTQNGVGENAGVRSDAVSGTLAMTSKAGIGALSGLSASLCMWSIMAPADCIRTQVQVTPKKTPLLATIKTIYKTRGIGAFWAGLGAMYIRACAITGPCMMGYEATRELVRRCRETDEWKT